MTLEQCLQTGLANNATLEASRLRTESADRDIKVARADYFPALTSSASYNRIDSKSAQGPTDTDYINQKVQSANIKLTQILYAGSRIVNNHDKAKLLEQAAQAEQASVKLELAYKIESTFYKLMKAKQDVIVAGESVARLRESVRAAEAFFAKELVPKVDLLSARVDLADAENQQGVAQNNENRQRVALFSLMNLPPDPGLDFIDENKLVVDKRPEFEDCYKYL